VGATGFEPVTPSVSAKPREPLCCASFSQVAADRRCRGYMLSSRSVKCSSDAARVPLTPRDRYSSCSTLRPLHRHLPAHTLVPRLPRRLNQLLERLVPQPDLAEAATAARSCSKAPTRNRRGRSAPAAGGAAAAMAPGGRRGRDGQAMAPMAKYSSGTLNAGVGPDRLLP
jgi:hypothetical protein